VQRQRGEEVWAIRCISAVLGVEVEVHDDGSSAGMHDLSILYPDRPPGAVEVTAAADQLMIETWILATRGGRWIVEGIEGGWGVSFPKGASVQRLRAELPDFLRELEALGVQAVDPETRWEPGPHDPRAASLGISHLYQGGTSFPGCVYLLPQQESERTGGAVPTEGGPLLEWIADWLARPDQAHNLEKLARSGAEERHIFLILPGFAEARFPVVGYLTEDDAYPPTADPDLPPEVTHVWIASTWAGGHGMRWSPDGGWQRFDKQFDVATD
jgi:hypothetical protein